MTDKREQLKLDEVLEELQYLREENHDLKVENDFLRRMKRGLMLNNQALTEERNQICDELNTIKAMGMFEFADKYCNDNKLEEAGKAFARELLGKPMTHEDLAIEAAENGHEPYTGDDF